MALLLKSVLLVLAICFLSVSQTRAQTWMDDFNNALAAMDKGDYESAIVSYEKALPGVKTMFGADNQYYSICLNQLAQLYEFVGRYDKAEQLFFEAIAIAKRTVGEKHLDYAKIIDHLGVLYRNINQNEKSEELLLESVSIYKAQLGETNIDYAKILNDLGLLYANMGQYDKAENLYLQSALITKNALGEKTEEYSSCIDNLALLYSKMFEYKKSEEKFLEVIAIRKQVLGEKNELYATALAGLSQLYMHFGEYKKAEPLMLESIENEKQSLGETHPQYATSIHNLAALYEAMGEYSKSEKFYLQSLAISKSIQGEHHPQYAIGLHGLAELYNSMHEFEKAEKYFLESLSILKTALGNLHPDYEVGVSNLATFYMENNQFEKAEPWYKESENILRQNIENNFEFLSETEKEKYAAKVSYNFDVYQGFYYKYHQKKSSVGKSSFNIQLAIRGMILNSDNRTRSAIMNSNDTGLIRLNENWKALKITLSQQYSKPVGERNEHLKNWETEATSLEKELIKRSSDFANQQNSKQAKWSDVRNKLKPNDAAIEFISFNYHDGKKWTDSILYIAVLLTHSDSLPIYIPLFEEKQLLGLLQGDTLRTFANLLYTDAQVRTVENEISYGDSLYQLIWKPLDLYLKNVTHIYYAPSGLLHNLNFDAIPNKENTLLSDKYTLHRLTTTSKILEKEVPFNPKSISLFGGIDYETNESELKKRANNNRSKRKKQIAFSNIRSVEDENTRSGFNYLPGSKIEVDSISGLLRKNKISTQIYTENHGTEEAVKNLDEQNSPSIIHFSTHGFFFPDATNQSTKNPITTGNEPVFKYADNPLFRSGLIMAGADFVWKGNTPVEGVEDGILTSYEISDLYLPNTKLVVMSACETGLGEIKGSEGVYGLQRAFKMAGVEYIIMTLWQVLDKETAEFMTLFYQYLIEKKSISTAFKNTQDVMKNKYRNEPYKWAGFVLIK
jgi:CHAT domain-containing protein